MQTLEQEAHHARSVRSGLFRPEFVRCEQIAELEPDDLVGLGAKSNKIVAAVGTRVGRACAKKARQSVFVINSM
jgi:hypothetical protein